MGKKLIILLMVIIFVPCSYAHSQISPACNMHCTPCKPDDLVCLGRYATHCGIDVECLKRFGLTVTECLSKQTTCQAKLEMYKAYMLQLGMGVTQRSLPSLYVQILAPHFPQANVSGWRFGFADRQQANNATTDCTISYYNNREMVDKMRQGELSTNSWITWMLHEMSHYQQCMQKGGRDFYARMWFDHLSEALFRNYLQAFDFKALHDRMALEADAERNAQGILKTLTNCCIDVRNKLVMPIKVESINANKTSIHTGDTVRLTAQVNGGSEPMNFWWQMQQPGSSSFMSIPSSEGNTNEKTFDWTPQKVGSYKIKFDARHSVKLNDEKIVTFDVKKKLMVAKQIQANEVLHYPMQRPLGDLIAHNLSVTTSKTQLKSLLQQNNEQQIGIFEVSNTFGQAITTQVSYFIGESNQCGSPNYTFMNVQEQLPASGTKKISVKFPRNMQASVLALLEKPKLTVYICAMVDSNAQFKETHENNNCKCTSLK
jgi:hypothetical protein